MRSRVKGQEQRGAMKPQHPRARALFVEGNRLLSAGDVEGAESCLRAVLCVAPDFAEAHANLGFLLDRRGASAEAEICYRRSLALNSAYAKVHMNLGVLLAGDKRFDEAEAAYGRAIALDPRSAAAWSNLGVLLACTKREAEAERCYRTALELDAMHAGARFNLSYLLLRQGRYAEGWHCLEAREWYDAVAAHIACPRWQGESLRGKSLLIGCEAGHGDMIQFGRYAAVLKAQDAARIDIICHPGLKTLFGTLDDVDSVIALGEPMSGAGWDYWTPPLSIPCHCRTRLDSIPATIPYLHAAPELSARWGSLLPADGVRVGLAWKGSPQFENDADRSLPRLDLLLPLGAVAGVRFVSLQKGAGEAEAARPPAGLPLLDLAAGIASFADTAAILANLDLVICVDTAVAHLAGALGKPCWVMLPYYKTDWRWLADRSDSPWYPGCMRLFRQTAMGDWSPVIAEVAAALERFVSVAHADPNRAIARSVRDECAALRAG